MSAATLLRSLLAYQAWANDELLEKLAGLDPRRSGVEHRAALRLMNHIHVVSRIFAAHLTGVAHGYASDNTEETPEPAELRAAMAESDRWYRDYVETVSGQQLAEPVAFIFTDGDKGCMTRQEMLTHVVLHGSYHRGEIGRMLAAITVTPPWDTYAVHLHQVEPSRRLHCEPGPLDA
ncbi:MULTISPECIES: DinB family protein [unclassified Mesorhizobium]|uniref:DinB family protein n=1 Tax=unclassified Mesorhizobium TaxID=325217 RepID=UPI000F74EF66|nr:MULTISPECIES: DinB family protein [unclassified Mesorhizobium]AZO31218.1 damage-inducible protein DinB [Mesorhizobium sp. M1B.F.Ca.ET.045.04.1.1]RWB19369.1 MAG: damage-inducible protein DinB [Mesorhizobium sp.]